MKRYPHRLYDTLLDSLQELRENQLEPAGAPADQVLDKRLRYEAAETLTKIVEVDPLERNRKLAAVRRSWILEESTEGRDNYDRQAADIWINYPVNHGWAWDIGYLCHDEALQGRVLRRDAQRYAGWIYTPNLRGQRLLAAFPSLDQFNALLPTTIQPAATSGAVTPPLAYHGMDVLRTAGQSSRADHITNFFPEDAGTKPRGRKYTIFYTNLYADRFHGTVMPIARRRLGIDHTRRLVSVIRYDLEHHLLALIRGHELGHFSGLAPLRMRDYPFGTEYYPLVEELRADATWLFASSHLSKVLPDEQAWRDHMLVFFSELLRYISRDIRGRADSASAFLMLNYLREHRAIRVDHSQRLRFDFERIPAVVEKLMLEVTAIVQAGSLFELTGFFAAYGYDLHNKCPLYDDAFLAQLTPSSTRASELIVAV